MKTYDTFFLMKSVIFIDPGADMLWHLQPACTLAILHCQVLTAGGGLAQLQSYRPHGHHHQDVGDEQRLIINWGVEAKVLYDGPPEKFKPITDDEKKKSLQQAVLLNYPVFIDVNKSTVLVSLTSWTEDFGVLLDGTHRPALSSSLPHHSRQVQVSRELRANLTSVMTSLVVERIQVESKTCFIDILNSNKFTFKFNTFFLFLNYSIVISTILSIFSKLSALLWDITRAGVLLSDKQR